jgi:hypothetical protein
MACSANHSKGSGSGMGQGLIVGQPAWLQRKIHLRPQHRGVHLVTEEILRQVCTSHPVSYFRFRLEKRKCKLLQFFFVKSQLQQIFLSN